MQRAEGGERSGLPSLAVEDARYASPLLPEDRDDCRLSIDRAACDGGVEHLDERKA